MSRSTFVRPVLAAIVTVFAVLPATASAAKPLQFHEHFTDSFSGDICGIAVDIDIVGTNNFFFYDDGTFKNTGSFKSTFTNPENGQSVVVSSAGQLTGPPPIIDEEAGTITFLTSYKGLPEKIQTGHGAVLLRDAGVITFADTFDLETGDLISSETIIKGPHPEAESDFTLFCEVITAALT
jgi:hypothetical protein